MSIRLQPKITTLEEYEAFPEDVRAEVFDGQPYYLASPSRTHQAILLELSSLLRSYVKQKAGGCEVLPAPFDVKLSDDPLTLVQPDIMIVCDKNKLSENRCNGAPDWIIEITSLSTQNRDYLVKLFKYRDAGVREYWIVNPSKQVVQTYYFEGEDVSGLFSFDEDIPVQIYDGWCINIAALIDF